MLPESLQCMYDGNYTNMHVWNNLTVHIIEQEASYGYLLVDFYLDYVLDKIL